MILTILIVILILNAAILIISILLQPRSQGGIGSAFGVGVADSIFGGKGGMDFLTKLTAVLSVVFVTLIMIINFYLGAPTQQGTIMEREETPTQQTQPTSQGEQPQSQPVQPGTE
ncbi:preprotein translocase subunit SecG [bacterium]|nr:MAG: preprotein translocase subunit SecG [bacterium]